MASLYNVNRRKDPKFYRDYFSSIEDQLNALKGSSTIYVGNLSFSTTEERIFAAFSCCGPIDKVIMGINRRTLAPCGFCFVIFYTHEAAQNAVDFMSGLKIDGMNIRVEMDWGFSDGRQYGRAMDGGQIRHYVKTIMKKGQNLDRRQDGYGYHDNRKRERDGGYNSRYGDSRARYGNESDFDYKRHKSY